MDCYHQGEYRAARRELLKNIILMQLTGNATQDYVEKETQRLIPMIDQAEFIKTINEELSVLAPSHIAGLGITKEQLIAWQEWQKK